MGELFKLRYKLSDATTATVSYFGSQVTSDQNGNVSSLIPSLFTPTSVYTGTAFPVNSGFLMSSVFAGLPEIETNNEPIFQAEIRSTYKQDTILARWYNAAIQRIINSGNDINTPGIEYANVWGTGPSATNGSAVSI